MTETLTTSQTLLQTTITITETVPPEYSLSQKRTNKILSNSVDETQDTDNNGVNISAILAQTSIAEQEPQACVPNDRQQQPGEVHLQIQETNQPPQQNSEAVQRENQQNKILELQNILQKSAEFRFRRAFFVCITIFIGLFSLEQAMEGDLLSLRGLYIISCSFLGYYLIENIILTMSKDILLWKRAENLFDTLDIAILIIFIVCMALKTTNGLDFPVKAICVLPAINLLFYIWKSSAPKTEKRALLLLRFFCVLQAFVLSERIDEDFILAWSGTLFIVWMFLGSITLCFLFFAGMTIYAIIAGLLGRTMPFEMDKKVQIKGLVWVTIYSSLGVVAFLGFVADVNEKKELIKLCFSVAKILSVVAVMFSLATYSSVIEFLRNSDIEENVYKEHLGLLTTTQGDMDGVSVERKNVFLVRLSSTYFSLLNATFFVRSKKEVTLIRRNRTEKMIGKSVINNEKICVTQREMTVVQSPNNMNAADKICLTEVDDKYMEDLQKMQEEEQQLCYICCNRTSNAVIVECGHGGVCSECAVEVIKTKGHCMQCRKEARKVVKIDNRFVGTNIVKGYETITVKEVHVTD